MPVKVLDDNGYGQDSHQHPSRPRRDSFVPFPAGPNLRFGTAHTFRQVAQIRNVAEVKWPQRGLENYVSAGMPTNRSAHTASGVVRLSGSASVANNSSRALRRRKTSTSGSILALTFELFCWKFQNLRQEFPRTAEINPAQFLSHPCLPQTL